MARIRGQVATVQTLDGEKVLVAGQRIQHVADVEKRIVNLDAQIVQVTADKEKTSAALLAERQVEIQGRIDAMTKRLADLDVVLIAAAHLANAHRRLRGLAATRDELVALLAEMRA